VQETQREVIDASSDVTVAQYFSQHFNHVARQDEPVARSSDDCLLPASFLMQIGLSHAERHDAALVGRVAAASARVEADARERIADLMHLLQTDKRSAEVLSAFGLSIGGRLELTGKLLKRPELVTGSGRVAAGPDLKYDLTQARVAIPPKLQKVPVVIAQDPLDTLCSHKLAPALLTAAAEMNIDLPNPIVIAVKTPRPPSAAVLATEMIEELSISIRTAGCPSFVLIVVEEGTVEGLTRVLSVDWGIPSTVLTFSEVFSSHRELKLEIGRRILTEITAKCGGVPHFVPIPGRPTIAVGVSARDGLVSCVASIDRTFARFTSHIGTIEDIGIGRVISSAVSQFPRLTGLDPTRIIVYYIRKSGIETHALLKAIKTNLEVVVCGLEEAAHVFPKDPNEIGSPVVIDALGTAERGEFLLSTGQATTKYTVVFERPKGAFAHDDVMLMTFWLCFNWPKIPGASPFPSPIMAANANREYAEQYLQGKQPSEHLKTSLLYFLS
jgi:hypothetical protein